MNRRTVLTRLNADVEAPEDRNNFKHPLPGWAQEHRVELVSACLSIVQHWINSGMPRSDATLGRFESWAGIMGGVLGVLGVSGFLLNREAQNKRDPESQEWDQLCTIWWREYSGHPISAKDLLEMAKANDILLSLWGGRSAIGAQQRIGHALVRRRDRVFGEYCIRFAGDGPTRNNSYRLEERTRYKTP